MTVEIYPAKYLITWLIIESKYPKNSLNVNFPYGYIKKNIVLSWYDVLFLIENGFAPHKIASLYACDLISSKKSCPQQVWDLACLSKADLLHECSIHPFIDELAASTEPELKKLTEKKILYILLKWLFENRELYEEPLNAVNVVYDDFGYPESMKNFISYMPTDICEYLHGDEKKKLLENWRTFIDEQGKKYGILNTSSNSNQ